MSAVCRLNGRVLDTKLDAPRKADTALREAMVVYYARLTIVSSPYFVKSRVRESKVWCAIAHFPCRLFSALSTKPIARKDLESMGHAALSGGVAKTTALG
jgi:hypothetical protein